MRHQFTYAFVAFLAVICFVLQPATSAITASELRAIRQNTPFANEDQDVNSCAAPGSETTSPGDTSSTNGAGEWSLEVQLAFTWSELNNKIETELPKLNGSGNRQKAFNYFVSKGLSDIESAAIIGNFMQESQMNPKAVQNGGPGRGIAQWSEGDRWEDLKQYVAYLKTPAEPAGAKEAALKSAEDALGDESAGLRGLAENKNNLAAATESFVRVYERAGDPVLDTRIDEAQKALDEFGSGNTGGNANDGSAANVSGSSAACGSVAGVDCSGGSADGKLSQLRQNVVCLAEAELALYESGKLKPGNDYHKYSQGQSNNWCGYFVSWIYNQATYPINEDSKDGIVGLVSDVKAFGEAGKRFTYQPKEGYTPIPGDMVIQKNGVSHVNIVVGVNANKGTITVIGGNQGGSSGYTTSRVTKYDMSITDSKNTGFVSPKEQ